MKTRQRLICLAVVIAMLFSMSVPVLADNSAIEVYENYCFYSQPIPTKEYYVDYDRLTGVKAGDTFYYFHHIGYFYNEPDQKMGIISVELSEEFDKVADAEVSKDGAYIKFTITEDVYYMAGLYWTNKEYWYGNINEREHRTILIGVEPRLTFDTDENPTTSEGTQFVGDTMIRFSFGKYTEESYLRWDEVRSTDESILKLSAHPLYSGDETYVLAEFLKTGTVKVEHTDDRGKVYSVTINVKNGPRLAKVKNPKSEADYFTNEIILDENGTFYLTAEDSKLTSVRLDEELNAEISLAKDGSYAAIKIPDEIPIGRVCRQRLYYEFTVEDTAFSLVDEVNLWGPPAFVAKSLDWNEYLSSLALPIGEYTFTFYFENSGKELNVSDGLVLTDVRSTDESIVRVVDSPWYPDAQYLQVECLKKGAAQLQYTDAEGKVHSITVEVGSGPRLAKVKNPKSEADYFTDVVELEDGNKTFYLVAEETEITEVKESNYYWGDDPNIADITLAEDGSYAEITIKGDIPVGKDCKRYLHYRYTYNEKEFYEEKQISLRGDPQFMAKNYDTSEIGTKLKLSAAKYTMIFFFAEAGKEVKYESDSLVLQDIRSTDESIVRVVEHPNYSDPWYLQVECLKEGTAQLQYTDAEGKVHSITIEVGAGPRLAKVKNPKSEEDYLGTEFVVSDNNKTFYLVAGEAKLTEITCGSMSKVELAADGSRAAITVTGEVPKSGTQDTIRFKYEYEGKTYSDSITVGYVHYLSGLGYRAPYMNNQGVYVENPDYDVQSDPIRVNDYTMEFTQYFYFGPTGDEVRLSADQLKSENEKIVTVGPSTYIPNAVTLTFVGYGETTLCYTGPDGKEYRIPVERTMPAKGFFTTTEYKAEYCVASYEITAAGDQLYYLWGNMEQGTRFTKASVSNSAMPVACEISEDGRYIIITFGENCPREGELNLEYTYEDKVGNVHTDRGCVRVSSAIPCFYLEGGASMIRFDSDIMFEKQSYGERIYTVSYGSDVSGIFYFFDGKNEIPVNPDDIVFADPYIVETKKTDYSTENEYTIIRRYPGETEYSYKAPDGKTYRIPVVVELPVVGLYTSEVPSAETYVDSYTYVEGGDNTLWLHIVDGGQGWETSLSEADINSHYLQNAKITGLSADKRSIKLSITPGEVRTNDVMSVYMHLSRNNQTFAYGDTLNTLFYYYVYPYSADNKCGENLYWSYDRGVLTVYEAGGTGGAMDERYKTTYDTNGEMEWITEEPNPPWRHLYIHTFDIQAGTSIDMRMLSCDNVVNGLFENRYFRSVKTTVNLPKTLQSVKNFGNRITEYSAIKQLDFPDGNDNGFYLDKRSYSTEGKNDNMEVTMLYQKTDTDLIHWGVMETGSLYDYDHVYLPIENGVTVLKQYIGSFMVIPPTVVRIDSDEQLWGAVYDKYLGHYCGTQEQLAAIKKEWSGCGIHGMTLTTGSLSCTEGGHPACWYCADCGIYFDADTLEYITPEEMAENNKPLGHNWVTSAYKAATCTEEGSYEYRYCDRVNVNGDASVPCGAMVIIKDGKEIDQSHLTSVAELAKAAVIPVAAHKLQAMPAQAATYTAPGWAAHWKCSDCGALYADAAGKQPADKAVLLVPQLVEVKDGKAEINGDAVKEAIDKAAAAQSVTLTLNEAKAETKGVQMTEDVLQKIADTNKALVVETDYATVTMDSKAVDTVAASAKGQQQVTLEVAQIQKSALNEAQQTALKDEAVAVVISAEILCGNQTVSDFGGGKVTVKLPFTPEKGTVGTDYAIFYVGDDGSKEKLVTKYEDGCLTATLGHFSEYAVINTNPPAQLENPFTDIAEGAYYYDPVLWAVQNAITTGVSATEFGPDSPCNRGQVVTFLWRAAGKPAPASSSNPFTDVAADAYYYEAVLWAVEKGITTGLSATEFGPDSLCNRGQIVTFLWRAAGKPAPVSSNNPFADVAADAYYYEAVLWAVGKGITSGVSATEFAPDTTCIRAQVVTFLYRSR